MAKRLLESGAPIDDTGHPINPRGDTGVQFGRGINNQWGPNQAGDGHITRIGPETGTLELLAGRRSDNNRYATPGGRFDPKHDRVVGDTIGREIREESGLDLDFTAAPISYQGPAVDDRDVNQAYMVTECRRIHLSPEDAVTHQPTAGDDLTSAEFVIITPELLDEMHAIHGQLVTFSVHDLITEQPSLAAYLHPTLAAHLGVTNQKAAAPAPAGRGAIASSTANAALAAPTTPEVTPTARFEPPTRPAGRIPAAQITDPQISSRLSK